jgi:hypothetical protein
MLSVRVFQVIEINVEGVIEDGLGLLKGDSMFLQIGPGLIFVPLETHVKP